MEILKQIKEISDTIQAGHEANYLWELKDISVFLAVGLGLTRAAAFLIESKEPVAAAATASISLIALCATLADDYFRGNQILSVKK